MDMDNNVVTAEGDVHKGLNGNEINIKILHIKIWKCLNYFISTLRFYTFPSN